jgi:phosphoenolpyruvate---glycerone phosphotransferase subunit DhaL
MQELTITDIKSIILNCRRIMAANRDYLIDLDSAMGDGDLGITMTRAFEAAGEEAIESKEPDPGKFLIRVGMNMAKAAPSTLGTLMATGFMKGGKAIQGQSQLGLNEISAFFSAFTQGIIDRGKSKPGNKTIIDSLLPAAESLAHAVQHHQPLDEGMREALQAAIKGVEDSKQMKAEHGRAAYYQEGSIGKQDPGATAGMFLIQSFYEGICNIA